MTGQNSHLNIGNDQIYPILYNGKVWVVTTAKYLENNDGRTDLVTRHLQVYPLLRLLGNYERDSSVKLSFPTTSQRDEERNVWFSVRSLILVRS